MNYYTSNINKHYNSFRQNKILLNIPNNDNIQQNNYLSYYSSSAERNNDIIKGKFNNKNHYLTINNNSTESKNMFNYQRNNTFENYYEDPTITNIKFHFNNINGKINKIKEVVSTSNPKSSNFLKYNLKKSRNVFPIEQIKYETTSQFNNYHTKDNLTQINNEGTNSKNEKYKNNKRTINRSLNNESYNRKEYINSFDSGDKNNKKNSNLKAVNVAKISFTPNFKETSINESNIGKVSIEITGNKSIKKDPSDNNLNLSELANDLVKTFNLDNNKKKKKEVKSEKKYIFQVSKYNLKTDFFNKEKKLYKIKADKIKDIEKNNDENDVKNHNNKNKHLDNHLMFTPQKIIDKDKIINFKKLKNENIKKNNLNDNGKENININHQEENKNLEEKGKIESEKNDNNNLNEESEEDIILKEIMETVYNQNRKNERKSRHISFNFGEISKKKVQEKEKTISDSNLYQILMNKINKQKGNLLPFKKEEIIIDNNYVSAELKDEFELFKRKKRENIKEKEPKN